MVLGHGHDVDTIYQEWYQTNKTRKEYQPRISRGKVKYDKNDDPVYLGYFLEDETMGNWKSQTRYDAINSMVYDIESYYEDSEKKTQEVLDKNKEYFKSIDNIENIIVIGHSLSDVDIPYFKEIIKNNINRDNLNWYFSVYSPSGLDKVHRFSLDLGISSNKVKVFKV